VSPAGQIAASSVVLGNLIYIVGAVVLMIVISLVVVLRQRKPKSVEANMESFNRGLRALAPSPTSPRRGPAQGTGRVDGGGRIEPRRRTVQAVVEPEGESTTETDPG
jgi:hypothetical protein